LLTHFQYFSTPITEYELPSKFTFPFYYEPHVLCKIASTEVQNYLKTQTDFKHNFGLEISKKGMPIGKMFGVLVVQNQKNEIGYITAVSGKLAETNSHKKFIPPVFDMLDTDSYYLRQKGELNTVSDAIESLENNSEYNTLIAKYKSEGEKATADIREKKEELKHAKTDRDLRRDKARTELSAKAFTILDDQLSKGSLKAKHFFNNVNRFWEYTLAPIKEKLSGFKTQITLLKTERKTNQLPYNSIYLNNIIF